MQQQQRRRARRCPGFELMHKSKIHSAIHETRLRRIARLCVAEELAPRWARPMASQLAGYTFVLRSRAACVTFLRPLVAATPASPLFLSGRRGRCPRCRVPCGIVLGQTVQIRLPPYRGASASRIAPSTCRETMRYASNGSAGQLARSASTLASALARLS